MNPIRNVEQAMMPTTSAHAATGTDPVDDELADLAMALIESRYSVAPKHLVAPGPRPDELQRLVQAALTAPDHNDLRPWRLIVIGDDQRGALADLFEACARDRTPPPEAHHLIRAREKAFRAPTLLLAVLRHRPHDDEVPTTERAVTLGAALMAMLLAAHGLGYGAMLTSGRSVRTPRFARAFGLDAEEEAVCFISIGSVHARNRHARLSPHEVLSTWLPGSGLSEPLARGQAASEAQTEAERSR